MVAPQSPVGATMSRSEGVAVEGMAPAGNFTELGDSPVRVESRRNSKKVRDADFNQ